MIVSRVRMGMLFAGGVSIILYFVGGIYVFRRNVEFVAASDRKFKSPPVVVNLRGGLGNQLFQYAAAYSLAKKRNSDLYICVDGWDYTYKSILRFPYSSKRRSYTLDQFNIPQNNMIFYYYERDSIENCFLKIGDTNGDISNIAATEQDILAGNVAGKNIVHLRDWFESDIFFKEVQKDIFNLFQINFDVDSIAGLLDQVKSTESVSVHFRRGDFGRKSDFRIISASYQMRAMQIMQERLKSTSLTFFVFTDDVAYVKKQFGVEWKNVVFMSELTGDNALFDFLLMMRCKYNIITNSTFSWWAAYLNKNPGKIVIAPSPKYSQKWINETYQHSDHKRKLIGEFAYPKKWIRIHPDFSIY